MAGGALVARAPAKVNLSLHILGRRADGFHALDSLVAFAGFGDRLRLTPGDALSLSVEGPTAQASGDVADNLVLLAARALQQRCPALRAGAFRLTKRLPVAAGVGGGSSDAAAALRLLAELNGIPADDSRLLEAARASGSDVPVCLDPCARRMAGTGEIVGPPLHLPALPAVLVNPGVAVSTPAVFRALGLAPGEDAASGAHPPVSAAPTPEALWSLLRETRNDLESPALRIAPVIADVLAALRARPGCRLARMSGSGATVFGLFDTRSRAALASRELQRLHPAWWVRATVLR
ncbi:4-(cytidine 5'-diphospho)-2-C-methyl-D-erythritol kinase [Pseudochelatococcus lubricantis]|uniref:4-(cytidine 5'-diphospho)-2-C-methyl-D-erythritol kinase n=1 Tax=Pseudochelatococcus lubricantis TaxID=1538102 RepID=UPI0035EAEA2F